MFIQCDLSNIINLASHLLESSSSCIYLILTSQPNIVTDTDVHPSLHVNCHHKLHMENFIRVMKKFKWERAFSIPVWPVCHLFVICDNKGPPRINNRIKIWYPENAVTQILELSTLLQKSQHCYTRTNNIA